VATLRSVDIGVKAQLRLNRIFKEAQLRLNRISKVEKKRSRLKSWPPAILSTACDGHSSHRNNHYSSCKLYHEEAEKQPSDALDDDAYGAWEIEPADKRFYRHIHQE
jgi:hypothetical protein